MNAKAQLRRMLIAQIEHAPEGEPFELASGKSAAWVLNAEPVTYGWPTIVSLAVMEEMDAVAPTIGRVAIPDAIGGPEITSAPISLGIASRLDVRTFVVRRDRFQHQHRPVVGSLHEGDKVIIVDSVFDAGDFFMGAVSAAIEAGAEVIAGVVLLYCGDMTAGGLKRIALPNHDHVAETPSAPFISLFTPADLGIEEA